MRGGSDTAQERARWMLGIVLVLFYALVPILWLASLSFKAPADIGLDKGFFPSNPTTQNYEDIFTGDSPFERALFNSFGIAAIATTLAITVAAMAAYALARLNFPGKNLILYGSLAISMFPPISIVGSLFNLWRNIGLFDTWPGLIIPYLTFSLPLAIYTLQSFYREIPWELEQAAAVDGATPWQAFTKVILPLAAPGTFTAAILVFIFCWNDFIFANTLTSTEAARTVPPTLTQFTGASQFDQPIGAQAAASMIVTIPIIIVVMIFQRRIVAGLTAGAVKG